MKKNNFNTAVISTQSEADHGELLLKRFTSENQMEALNDYEQYQALCYAVIQLQISRNNFEAMKKRLAEIDL